MWLPSIGLVGTMPTQLGRLTAITGLSLQQNSLTGSLPTQLGPLSAMKNLYLKFY